MTMRGKFFHLFVVASRDEVVVEASTSRETCVGLCQFIAEADAELLRQTRKEAPVHRRTDRLIDRPLCAPRRETLDVVHVQILRASAPRLTRVAACVGTTVT